MAHKSLIQKIRYRISQELGTRRAREERFNWANASRSSQRLPQGDWKIWLILAGRGFGKTRAGAEAVRFWATSGRAKRLALVGQTEADVEHVMIHGESGLLAVHPDSERPHYSSSKGHLLWPSGAIATVYSAERYEKLRGPQFDGAWVDELAKYRHPEKLWEQLMFALRLGDNPQVIVTTTPRPLPLLKKMIAHQEGKIVLTRGSTFENQANLSPTFLNHMKNRYAKSPLGRQELEGALLENQEGTLWTWPLLEAASKVQEIPPLERIIVAVDPAMTAHHKSDETGIIVAGRAGKAAYVLEDLSGRYTPSQWTQVVLEAYQRHKADKVVAEVNQGGDLVEQMLRSQTQHVAFKAVRASRGKKVRAEPIAHLYERGFVHHVGALGTLEEQLCSYNPSGRLSQKSPDRMDALVWALTELMLVPYRRRHAWLAEI